MAISRRQQRLFLICVITLCSCVILVGFLSGFQHETHKFKALLLTIVLLLLIIFLAFDVAAFAVIAMTTLTKNIALKLSGKRTKSKLSRNPDKPTRSNFLRLRIKSLKAQFFLTREHQDETQNLYFRAICNDLWPFLRYFILLLLVVVGSRNQETYYNTNILTRLLSDNRILAQGIEALNTMPEVWDFIEVVLIEAFNEGKGYDGEIVSEPGWIHMEIAKLLGVVRMRLIRFRSQAFGLHPPEIDEDAYLPGWKKPYKKYHYINKYWRIYEPWLPKTDFKRNWLLPSQHYGYLYIHPEYQGYVSLLARNKQNSMTVLEYLTEHEWFDNSSGAVFFDFTLYNVNSNIFSIVKVLVEKTPFGALESHVEVQSTQLLMNIENLSYLHLLILLLYILQLLQFAKMLIMRAWYIPKFCHSAWNIFDCSIILLNVLLFTLIYIRERYVVQLIASIESAQKLEFIDFRIAGQVDRITLYIAGFLIAFTTIRIWKILQFDTCFMLFTTTLSTSLIPLASVFLFIVIFQTAFSLSSIIINGNNSENFLKFEKSITSSLIFAFGFNGDVNPDDLNYGGSTLGLVMYLVLMVVVSIILFNIFITLLIDYGQRAKEALKGIHEKMQNQLNFEQFIRMEYRWLSCFERNSRRPLLKHNMTVTQNIEKTLSAMEEAFDAEPKELEKSEIIFLQEPLQVQQQQDDARIERLNLTAKILNTQLELVARELQMLDIEVDSEDEDDPTSALKKNDELIAVLLKTLLF